MPDGVNDMTIVLIPKVPHPKELKDFRPISLCNVVYKIVSKCMVNRLRPLLSELISENQSAFIPGRLILIMPLWPLSAFIIFSQSRITHRLYVPTNLICRRRTTVLIGFSWKGRSLNGASLISGSLVLWHVSPQ